MTRLNIRAILDEADEAIAETVQRGSRRTLVRGVQTPEERTAWQDAEAVRRGLSPAQKAEWLAAGGGSAWFFTPTWDDADEDDGTGFEPADDD